MSCFDFYFLTAGQGGVDYRVLEAFSQPVIPSLHERFPELVDNLNSNMKSVFNANDNHLVVPITGTGTAAMEILISNVIYNKCQVIVGVNGFFGERICEIIKRKQAIPIPIKKEWGNIITLDDIIDIYTKTNAKVIYLVHGETSTGILQPLEQIGAFCRANNILLLVDCATTIGGAHFYMEKWNINGAFTITQKCLGGLPGLSVIAIDEKYRTQMEKAGKQQESFYLDLNLIINDWYPPKIYHHTQPYSLLVSLNKCLELVLQEGLENRCQRHIKNGKLLINGLELLGMDLLVKDDAIRLPQLTTFSRDKLDIDDFLAYMKREFNVYISRGLGEYSNKIIRLGLMANNSCENKVKYVLFCIYTYLKSKKILVDESDFLDYVKVKQSTHPR